MVLSIGYFVTFGILLLLIFQVYWNFRKKFSNIPFFNILSFIVHCQLTGKITKKTSFNNVFFEKVLDVGKKYAKEGFFMTYAFKQVLFIYSPEAVEVFGKEKSAQDKAPESDIITEILGEGLSTSNGERWRSHRRLINPAFHMGVLKENIPLFNENAMELVKEMTTFAGEPSVNILDMLRLHYFNGLCESVFGLKRNAENKEQIRNFAENFESLSEMSLQRMIYPWLRPNSLLKFSSFGRKFLKKSKENNDFIYKILSDIKEQTSGDENEDMRQFGNHLRKTFTYILLNYHMSNPETFNLDDVHAEVKTILIAGYETVTSSTLLSLFLLGLHPDIQEKVFDEVQSLTSDYVTHEELTSLSYLEAVIMESQRIYPAVPLIGRYLSKDVQFGNHKFLKGTSIVFVAYLLHRNAKVYPDPEKFEPERFLNRKSKNEWDFIPFGFGTRKCIGKNYALIGMKIILAHIIRNFEITSINKREDLKLGWKITLTPIETLRFKITKRHKP